MAERMGDTDSEAAITSALRAAYRAYFRSVRFTGPVGSIAAVVVVVGLTRSSLPAGRLAIWVGVVVALCVAMVAAFSVERSARWTDDLGTPKLSKLTHLGIGLSWGSLLWLGPASSMDRALVMTILAVLFAVSAGAVGGIQPSTALSFAVVTPMWTLAAVRLAMLDRLWLAGGVIVFLVLLLSDLRAGADLFRQAVRFRLRSDIAARTATEDARRDALTGLPNRSGLEHQVEAMVGTGVDAVTVLFVDLDNFKDINDRFGHHAGDHVLRIVAERLTQTTRPDTVVARFGGDEFFLAVAGEPDADELLSLTTRLIHAIEEPIPIVGRGVAMVSASIGTTSSPGAAFDIQRAYVEADQALYDAKGQGRRRARSFEGSGMNAEAGVASRMREALADRAIEWWAQPILGIDTRTIESVELLARWQLDDGTFISPDVFIPVADASGLIGDLTRQVLAVAATALDRWRDHPGLDRAAVSVNLSARYLAEGTLHDDLIAAFAPTDLASGRLWLEITESHDLTAVHDIDAALGAAARLGAVIAVDDFGTGYTSVRQLHDLPVSVVKLDRWLTDDLGTDRSRAELARAVHSVAASLGHRIVAEGLERPAQINLVRELGIGLVQGYLLGEPMPLPDFDEWASQRSLISHPVTGPHQGSHWSMRHA